MAINSADQNLRRLQIAMKALHAVIGDDDVIEVQDTLMGLCFAAAAVGMQSGGCSTLGQRKAFSETMRKNVLGAAKLFADHPELMDMLSSTSPLATDVQPLSRTPRSNSDLGGVCRISQTRR